MSNFYEEKVVSVHHWTDRLFSFTTTRGPGLRFENGQFVMMGILDDNGRPLLRAYSIASPNYAEHLEFLSIKVPNGPLTSKLQHIKEGDTILMSKKPTGTLLLDNLEPGRNLYFFSTGTGLAPFMSLIRDPESYGRYEKVVLVHGVRQVAELAYEDLITKQLPADEFLGEDVKAKLVYYPLVTREPFKNQGRIPDLIENGKMFKDLGLPPLDPEHDRAMLCGSPEMIASIKALLEARKFEEGASGRPASYVVERAFVEK